METATFNSITIRGDYRLENIELPESIVINKNNPKNLSVDLKVNPTDAGIKDIVWSITEGSDILSIDSKTGVITADNEGSGIVKAIVTDVFGNRKEAATYVTVRVPVENITMNDITLQVKETKSLPITITPPEAINGVTIELSNPSIASIDKKNLKLTGLKPGQTTLIAKGINSEGNVIEKIATVTVQDVLVTSIKVSPNTVNMKKLESKRISDFTVVIGPENATNKEVVWESLNSSIVRIVDNKIEGVATGSAYIRIKSADAGDASTEITVNVGSPLSGISASEIFMNKGDAANAKKYIIYYPNDATNVNYDKTTYTSSDNYIVEVDHNGQMVAKRLGTATILITVYDEYNNDTQLI